MINIIKKIVSDFIQVNIANGNIRMVILMVTYPIQMLFMLTTMITFKDSSRNMKTR